MKHTYDIVVIGAGSAGLTAAVGAKKIGKSVLLIEKDEMGGECTNSGCIPSKALLHYAKQFHTAQEVSGGSAKSKAFRAAAFTYVRDKITEVLTHETPETFIKKGIDVVKGEAVFVDRCRLTVGDTVYHFKKAIIATGSQPRPLAMRGLDPARTLTNQNLFDLESVPERLLIVGGGPIGLEMAQAMAMLGSEIHLVERSDTLARLEDSAIRPYLADTFAALGISVHTSTTISHINETTAFLTHGGGATSEVPFTHVLIAIGRVPTFPKGLKAADIAYDDNRILVDSQFRTSNKYVYAIGDVAQTHKFTHTADDTARQVIAHIASKGLLRHRRKAVPKVTYTKPEMAQVGLSFEAAQKRYRPEQLMRIEVPLTQNDRAMTDDTTNGVLVVIARRLNGAILGAHLIAPRAGELITVFTLAIDQKISFWKLQRLIIAYPTYSLLIKKAADQFVAKQFASLQTDLVALIKRHAPKLIAALFWATLIYVFQHYRLSHDLSYQDLLWQLFSFFTTTAWGPLVYIVLYAVRPLIFFPATLLTALSGALFGFWWGILYTVIGENASANFAYMIGRFFGKDLRLEDSAIGNWVESLRSNSFEAVLLMRLFYVPFDLTNYGAGVIGAKWREYFFATLIGIMPGLTTFVALGAAVDLEEFRTMGLTFDAFDPRYLALSVVIFIASLILSRYIKRWRAAQ